ncbi:MAG TPA: DNA-binding response regulator [Bacteroidales bacterium]|nr:MAG: DNA-binding response regulator [Bacteroidetes bacterium GWF2_33_38]OFY87509.1 MAG: DNA-binding response regulator [Bacteroidetes bacterium RIFOXYA2_FULL_33_7]HBF88265.1 DNA-binding response regulator [Bacteroidales bacterium]
MNKEKILLIDDEEDVLEFLGFNLKKSDFEVFTASNGKDGLKLAKEIKPDLIILDVMMPEMDGIETCEAIRNTDDLKNTLVIFLTARGEDYSQIAGFDAGADDYVIKPIKPKVLISRVHALLKRKANLSNQTNSTNAEFPMVGISIDKERFLVIKDGEELSFPKKEFELLSLLFSKPERVFSREEIMQSVWGDVPFVGDRTIDVHIRKLREKIGDNHIKTLKGVGYKFVP